MSLTIPYPWGAPLAVARSIIYGGMALTLLMNPSWAIFTTSASQPIAPRCDVYNDWALFCLVDGHLDAARVSAGVVLLVCASGIVPWLLAVPAAYLMLSTSVTMTLGDDGDQLYGILSLALLPVTLTDWRSSSWTSFTSGYWRAARGSIAIVGWWLIRAQIFVVYAEAAIGKLAVPEWAGGTALYYWLRSPTFGPADVLAPLVQSATAIPIVSGLATAGVIALEFALSIGPLFALRIRRVLLILGLLLHIAIIVFMGITSFSIVMFGALLLHLPSIDATFREMFPRKRDWFARTYSNVS